MFLQPARELNFSGAKFSHIEGWDIAAEHTVYLPGGGLRFTSIGF